MKHRIFCLCLLILLFSINNFAQKKPSWLNQIEEQIQQNELNPKVTNQTYMTQRESFKYVLFLVLNDGQRSTSGQQATIQIDRVINRKNPKEEFNREVEFFSLKEIAKDVPKTELKNIGDEGYIWGNIKGATKIMFRKSDIFVSIIITGEKTSQISFEDWAKTLAQSINKYLP